MIQGRANWSDPVCFAGMDNTRKSSIFGKQICAALVDPGSKRQKSTAMTEDKNPWKIISEKPVYKNNWITVTEFDVINPGGGKGIYGKVHYKNIAVGVLPLDDAMNTYLVGQYRFPLNAFSWEIPEGGCDPSEKPLEAAQRELIEETGLVARQWEQVLGMHLSNSISDEYAILYLARQLEQRTPMPEETEKLILRKLPFIEVYQMVEKGMITDAMSVATIQKVQLMLISGKLFASNE